ncbi:hypothetical protein DRO02_01545 [archaeon]|nr:MAG: hypothetical protein DRO02_01545 [archaeon]RLG65709.1 MAG: hypothetical protein DRO21_01440 [archaeon]
MNPSLCRRGWRHRLIGGTLLGGVIHRGNNNIPLGQFKFLKDNINISYIYWLDIVSKVEVIIEAVFWM